jgi:hypothetical protein
MVRLRIKKFNISDMNISLEYLEKKSVRSWIFCIPHVSVFLQLNEDLMFLALF